LSWRYPAAVGPGSSFAQSSKEPKDLLLLL